MFLAQKAKILLHRQKDKLLAPQTISDTIKTICKTLKKSFVIQPRIIVDKDLDCLLQFCGGDYDFDETINLAFKTVPDFKTIQNFSLKDDFRCFVDEIATTVGHEMVHHEQHRNGKLDSERIAYGFKPRHDMDAYYVKLYELEAYGHDVAFELCRFKPDRRRRILFSWYELDQNHVAKSSPTLHYYIKHYRNVQGEKGNKIINRVIYHAKKFLRTNGYRTT